MKHFNKPFYLAVLLLIINNSLVTQAQDTGSAILDAEYIHQQADSLANAFYNQGLVAGFSVAVLHDLDTLLLKAYGRADIGLDVSASPETKYRLVGPSGTILTILLMQQVEKGVISLDEDITHLLPDFPWQGRKLTLRQLLNATSGLTDYHYLGDPFVEEIAVPKSYDDVTALFAWRPFTHEPGERFKWTISGMHLAGVILERITGKHYKQLLREYIIEPLNLENTAYCGGEEVVPNLAVGHDSRSGIIKKARPESPSMYPFITTVCSSAGDVATIFKALLRGDLISQESFEQIISNKFNSRGMGLFAVTRDGKKRMLSVGGLLLGYSSFAQVLPEDEIIIVVLKNTFGGGKAFPLGQTLSKVALGNPANLPQPPTFRQLLDLPLTTAPDFYTGTYRTTFPNGTGTRKQYVRTYKIYEKAGELMIQAIGDVPERLLKQGENEFARASHPNWPINFTSANGEIIGIKIKEGDGTGVGPKNNETK